MKVNVLIREFVYNGTILPDPNPALTPQQVLQQYIPTFGELAIAKISGPDATGTRLRYTFHVSFGTKA